MNKQEFLKKWFTHGSGIWYSSFMADLESLLGEGKPLNELQRFLNYWTGRVYDASRMEEFARMTRELVAWAKEEGKNEFTKDLSNSFYNTSPTKDESKHIMTDDNTKWIRTANLRWSKESGNVELRQMWIRYMGTNIQEEWRNVPEE
jgi:hypothetical protein